MTLHLLRHGVAAGVEGRCIGQTDVPLAAGSADVFARVAASWPHARPARLVASPLARARASAAPLAAAWGLAPETEPRLAELDFGAWDGRPWADIEAHDGAALGAWMADWATAAPPGGESFAALRARAEAWLASLTDTADPAGGDTAGDTVAVAHAGTIRAVLVAVLGLDPAYAFRLDVAHGALTTVRLDPPVLVALNRPF